MYKTEVQKISDASVKKIAFMKKSPLSYILLSALAGIYLGFGIVLIFSISGPIAGAGGGAYLKLIMGGTFGIALSLVIFAGLNCLLETTWSLPSAVLKNGGFGADHNIIYHVLYRQLSRFGIPRMAGREGGQFARGFKPANS